MERMDDSNIETAEDAARLDRLLALAGTPAVPAALAGTTRLPESADALARSAYGVLPVLDAAGAYCGVVTSRSVAEALADGDETDLDVARLTQLPPDLGPRDTLVAGISALDASGDAAVPVVDREAQQLVGWLTLAATLAHLHSDPAGRPG